MPFLHFSCTLCGKCCFNHSVPLTMGEAIEWLEDNGQVGIYCEAIHSLPAPLDQPAAHRKRRAFSVPCGSSLLHVTAILVAVVSGACKNLGEDLKCRIYERRPLVCRIYPVEINPFVQLNPAQKQCPTEAWQQAESPDSELSQYLPSVAEKSRQTDYSEASRKGLLCASLGIHTAALAGEGYVFHQPAPQVLLPALKAAFRSDPAALPPNPPWILYSPRLANLHGLQVIAEKPPQAAYSYLRA